MSNHVRLPTRSRRSTRCRQFHHGSQSAMRGERGKNGRNPIRYRSVTLSTWEELSDPCADQEEILSGRSRLANSSASAAKVWQFGTALRDVVIKHACSWAVCCSQPVQVQVGHHEGGQAFHRRRESQVLERRFTIIEFDLRAFDWLNGFTRAREARLPSSAPLPPLSRFPLGHDRLQRQ